MNRFNEDILRESFILHSQKEHPSMRLDKNSGPGEKAFYYRTTQIAFENFTAGFRIAEALHQAATEQDRQQFFEKQPPSAKAPCNNIEPARPDLPLDHLDQGVWLPGKQPRKKPEPKTKEELAAIRAKAWATRRANGKGGGK